MCSLCDHVPRSARQPTPEALGAFIAQRKADVRAGVLVAVNERQGAFLDLEEEAPWAGDGFFYRLGCRQCAAVFDFGAATYRGPGGRWEIALGR